MAMARQANVKCKKWCVDHGLRVCEICGSNFGLTFAHRKKRRFYNSVAELSDHNEWILACIDCHNRYLEWDTDVKDVWFSKLRKGVLK
jgi:hypothetical protein